MLKKIIFICAFVGLVVGQGYAQSSATAVLNKAEDNFAQGNLSSIQKNLEVDKGKYFKKGGFSKEELIRAYRLLTLVHLYNDNEQKAEEAFVNLLKSDPEHPPTDADPAEFHFLHDKFNADPIFRISVKLGVVRASPAPFTGFGLAAESTGIRKVYTPGISILGEVSFEYQLPFNFEVIGGFAYSAETFGITEDIETGIAYTLTETQSWLKLPVMLRYNIELGSNFTPYVYGGYSLGYLLNAKLAGSRSGGQPLTIAETVSDSRSSLSHAVIGGAGLKIATKTNFVILEARYASGINNIVDSKNRYINQVLIWNGGYADDNFSQNNLSISLGYIMSFYNPKRLSEKKYNKKIQKKLKEQSDE